MKFAWYQSPNLNNNRKTLLTKGEVVRSNAIGLVATAVLIAPFFWAFLENLSK